MQGKLALIHWVPPRNFWLRMAETSLSQPLACPQCAGGEILEGVDLLRAPCGAGELFRTREKTRPPVACARRSFSGPSPG